MTQIEIHLQFLVIFEFLLGQKVDGRQRKILEYVYLGKNIK